MASSALLFPPSPIYLPLDTSSPHPSASSVCPVCPPRAVSADLFHTVTQRTSVCLKGFRKVPGVSQCHAIAFDSSGLLQLDASHKGDLLEASDIAASQEDIPWPENDKEGEDTDLREAWEVATSLMKLKDHRLEKQNSKSSEYSGAKRGELSLGARSESPFADGLLDFKDEDTVSVGRDKMPIVRESEGKEKKRERWITNGRSLKGLEVNEKRSEGFDAQEDGEPGDEATEPITKIPVPRQKYIPVSKVALVKTLSEAFNNDSKASEFLLICSFLDRILHAEHKAILEQMRLDFKITRSALKKEAEQTAGGPSRKTKVRKRKAWIETIRAVLAFLSRKRGRKVASKAPSNGKEQIASASLGGSSNGPLPRRTNDVRGEPRGAMRSEIAASSSSSLMATPVLRNDKVQASSERASRNNIPAAAARFQRNFLRLLRNAQFQGLSARDLQLTSALNSDYFLTLPIDVDWKQVSSENAIIYRRGYAAERQDGLLLGAKLDYIQSLVLRQMLSSFSGPLFRSGSWILQKWKLLRENEESKTWTEGIREWLREPLKPDMEDDFSDVITDAFTDQGEGGDLPFWIAARQAVPRYEAFLSSVGSRGMLLRRILVWMRLLPVQSANPDARLPSDMLTPKSLSRGNYLTRVSMRDIWLPASKVVCGGSFWRRIRAAFSVFFSRSRLQEPAFKELVLLYNIPRNKNGDADREEIPNLHLQIYGKIPIPDLKVVFPNKKLSFRILDTVRLDIATVIGLLAFLVNYRFDDFLSSPSAFLLDIIATSALIVYMTRVTLGYKRTWDRYQLLVNKTLYEKTLASGFGAAHFLIDASEQQQFKEAVLAFGLLMQAENGQMESAKVLSEKCEHFLYGHFKEQIEMPVEDALQILSRLGLVVRNKSGCNTRADHDHSGVRTIQILPHVQSVEMLRHRWNELLYDESIWTSSQV